MDDDGLQAVIVGCGVIAPNHLAGYRTDPRVAGVGACDPIEVEDQAEATVVFTDGTRGRPTAVNTDERVRTPDGSVTGGLGRFTYSTNVNGTLAELVHEGPDLVAELRSLEARCHELPLGDYRVPDLLAEHLQENCA